MIPEAVEKKNYFPATESPRLQKLSRKLGADVLPIDVDFDQSLEIFSNLAKQRGSALNGYLLNAWPRWVYKFAAPCELNRHFASAEENWKVSTWGSDNFENDDALDWIADFCDAPDRELLVDALSRVAEMDFFDDLKAPECRIGIAAAEVVAALKGAPNPNLPAEATECVSRLTIKADSSLVHLALKAVERIKTDSELQGLWDESETPDEWYSAVGNLEVRLKELDLETLFDVILDDMKAEEERAAEEGKPFLERIGAPVESAASIEEASMEDITQRLHDLLPEPSESGFSREFDEELYQQLEPLFSAILAHALKKGT